MIRLQINHLKVYICLDLCLDALLITTFYNFILYFIKEYHIWETTSVLTLIPHVLKHVNTFVKLFANMHLNMKLADHSDHNVDVCNFTYLLFCFGWFNKKPSWSSWRPQWKIFIMYQHFQKYVPRVFCKVKVREVIRFYRKFSTSAKETEWKIFQNIYQEMSRSVGCSHQTLTQNAAAEIWKHWKVMYFKICFRKGVTDSDSQCTTTAECVTHAYRQISSAINVWLQ